jgi:hypothetical protein
LLVGQSKILGQLFEGYFRFSVKTVSYCGFDLVPPLRDTMKLNAFKCDNSDKEAKSTYCRNACRNFDMNKQVMLPPVENLD